MTIPRPTQFRPNREGLRTLAFGLAVLGLCVFAWGLKYKLSLYDPPHSISHHIPAAKLLSGKERRALPLADVSPAAIAGTLAVLTAVFFAAGIRKGTAQFPGFGAWILTAPPRPASAISSRCAPAFIRPPPRLR
ncbi:MAG TPA: hypothetical protein VHZ25_00220 [Acidobacteriaceae bacterium]|nr:hypothetical protein [Acidobacteriaceae bacterium]